MRKRLEPVFISPELTSQAFFVHDTIKSNCKHRMILKTAHIFIKPVHRIRFCNQSSGLGAVDFPNLTGIYKCRQIKDLKVKQTETSANLKM